MRLFSFILGVCLLTTTVEARRYADSQDLTGDSITTTFELILSVPKDADHIECTNTSAQNMWFSLNGNESDCSDAAEIKFVLAGGTFVFDDYDVGRYICSKTDAGVANTGINSCLAWKPGVPQ